VFSRPCFKPLTALIPILVFSFAALNRRHCLTHGSLLVTPERRESLFTLCGNLGYHVSPSCRCIGATVKIPGVPPTPRLTVRFSTSPGYLLYDDRSCRRTLLYWYRSLLEVLSTPCLHPIASQKSVLLPYSLSILTPLSFPLTPPEFLVFSHPNLALSRVTQTSRQANPE